MAFEEEVVLSRKLMLSDPIAFFRKPKTMADVYVYLSSIKNQGASLDRPVVNPDMSGFLEALLYAMSERSHIFKDCSSPWDFIFEALEAGFYYE